jgi:uncharacterized membrane protein
MITVTLYSRPGCHLCEQAQTDLAELQNESPHTLTVVDIEGDPKLVKKYGLEIPVVEIGPYTLKAPIDRKDLLITLKAVQLSHQQDAAIDASIERGDLALNLKWTGADRFTHWMSRHYLAFFNLLVFVYLGLPFLAPTLMKAGAPAPARTIYTVYGFLCHQLPYRSWFLFGEQPVYPRSAAGLAGWQTFSQASGLGEGADAAEVWAARAFIGNEQMGYKVALCQRDVAIYGGMLLFGLTFAITGRRWRSIHWILWLAIGIAPMGLDGTTQLVSQYAPWISALLPFRESTPYLRTLTGALFGVTTAWFGYPMVEESMRDARQVMENKLRRIRKQEIRERG